MIISAKLICLVIAVILFFFAAGFFWWRPTDGRFGSLGWAGLFFFSLRELFP